MDLSKIAYYAKPKLELRVPALFCRLNRGVEVYDLILYSNLMLNWDDTKLHEVFGLVDFEMTVGKLIAAMTSAVEIIDDPSGVFGRL